MTYEKESDRTMGMVAAFKSPIARKHDAAMANPYDPECQAELAGAFFESGQSEQALEYAVKAWNVDHLNPRHVANIAVILCDLGRLEESITYWQKAIELAQESQNLRPMVPQLEKNLTEVLRIVDWGKNPEENQASSFPTGDLAPR